MVSLSTIQAEAVLRSQQPLRRLPAPQQRRQNHLQWCLRRSSWLPSDWNHIMFSDESRLTLEASDHRFPNEQASHIAAEVSENPQAQHLQQTTYMASPSDTETIEAAESRRHAVAERAQE
ncbi:hypothetical protein TNCV_2734791 [Trichonephila clavipes]|nr:hypothetical protein TNCV_2734791 [Trichonephila clavipes]